MESKTALALAAVLISLALLAWAPWLDDWAIHDRIMLERAYMDGTIDKATGKLVCDYHVMWAPFGRWVASCEGGYFVSFFG